MELTRNGMIFAMIAVAGLLLAGMFIFPSGTGSVPEVEISPSLTIEEWRIALSADKSFYGVEMHAPAHTEQEIGMKCYNNDVLVEGITDTTDEYGIVTFIAPLNSERVIIENI